MISADKSILNYTNNFLVTSTSYDAIQKDTKMKGTFYSP